MLKKLSLLIILLFISLNTNAISLIRDQEIESYLRDISNPIFKAAKLNPENIKLYIVNDKNINAFVMGGQNIFIHTGLMTKYNDPGVLIGVLAHEAGHIAGGHLARGSEYMQSNSKNFLIGTLLATALATIASPEAGQATLAAGTHVAKQNILKYIRTHEEAADQSALSYLDKMKYPAKGLLKLLQDLKRSDGNVDSSDEYSRTHPLSTNRIKHIRNHIKNKNYSAKYLDSKLQPRFDLVLAKLNGFLDDPDKIIRKYKNDNSVDARYAKAVAYSRAFLINRSLKEIDSLIKKYPNNPYFIELKGQILFESGRVRQSIYYYKKASELLPNSALIKMSLASGLTIIGGGKNIKKAIKYLKQALKKEGGNPGIWQLLANAYRKNKDRGMYYFSLTNHYLLKNDKEKTKKNLKQAKKYLKNNKVYMLKIKDIEEEIKKDK